MACTFALFVFLWIHDGHLEGPFTRVDDFGWSHIIFMAKNSYPVQITVVFDFGWWSKAEKRQFTLTPAWCHAVIWCPPDISTIFIAVYCFLKMPENALISTVTLFTQTVF